MDLRLENFQGMLCDSISKYKRVSRSLLLLVKDLHPSALKPHYHGNRAITWPSLPSLSAQTSPALPFRDHVPRRTHGCPGVQGGSAHLAGWWLTLVGSCGEAQSVDAGGQFRDP